MKKRILALSALTTGCASTGDVDRLAATVANLNRELRNNESLTAQQSAAIDGQLQSLSSQMHGRTENFIGSMSNIEAMSGAGGLGLLTAVGLNLYRNYMRKQRGEVTGREKVAAPPASEDS